MIRQIIIDGSAYTKAIDITKSLCTKEKKNFLIIPAQGLVKDFSGNICSIVAICDDITNKQVERIKLFMESFKIDYQNKLLNLNFCNFDNIHL
jgi:hypothetical protein